MFGTTHGGLVAVLVVVLSSIFNTCHGAATPNAGGTSPASPTPTATAQVLPTPIYGLTDVTTPTEATALLGTPLRSEDMGIGWSQDHQLGTKGAGVILSLSWSLTGRLNSVVLRVEQPGPLNTAALPKNQQDPILDMFGMSRKNLQSMLGMPTNCSTCPFTQYSRGGDPFGMLDFGFNNDQVMQITWMHQESVDEFMKTGFSAMDDPGPSSAEILARPHKPIPVAPTLFGMTLEEPYVAASAQLGTILQDNSNDPYFGSIIAEPIGAGEKLDVMLVPKHFTADGTAGGPVVVRSIQINFEFATQSQRDTIIAALGQAETTGTLATYLAMDYATLKAQPEIEVGILGELEAITKTPTDERFAFGFFYEPPRGSRPARLARVDLVGRGKMPDPNAP